MHLQTESVEQLSAIGASFAGNHHHLLAVRFPAGKPEGDGELARLAATVIESIEGTLKEGESFDGAICHEEAANRSNEYIRRLADFIQALPQEDAGDTALLVRALVGDDRLHDALVTRLNENSQLETTFVAEDITASLQAMGFEFKKLIAEPYDDRYNDIDFTLDSQAANQFLKEYDPDGATELQKDIVPYAKWLLGYMAADKFLSEDASSDPSEEVLETARKVLAPYDISRYNHYLFAVIAGDDEEVDLALDEVGPDDLAELFLENAPEEVGSLWLESLSSEDLPLQEGERGYPYPVGEILADIVKHYREATDYYDTKGYRLWKILDEPGQFSDLIDDVIPEAA